MTAIALAELRMLVRNRLVALCALLIPLALGVLILLNATPEGGASFLATLQIIIMIGMGVYITATTTLAARRQTLFLKRLRSAAVSDGSIIVGLVGPLVLVNLVQVAIIMVALSISAKTVPANGWLIAVVVFVLEIMFAAFALATAGVTNSPEHAQFTTLPLFIVTAGVPFWVSISGADGVLGVVQRVLPGGAVPELMHLAWDGGDLLQVPLLLLPTLVWAAVAVIAARVMFRWEPRA